MTRKSTPSPRPAPIPADVTVVFYSVHLAELEEWIGSGSEPRFQEAWAVVRDAEEGDWEPQELAVLERLLRRLILEGKHYPGLQPDEQYYLTQLLIDLLDEYVDQDALTEEIPLARLLTTWHEAPAAARPALNLLLRGRQWGGEALLWREGRVEDVLSYFGYLRGAELPAVIAALSHGARPGGKPSRLLQEIRAAATTCLQTETDLLTFVG